MTVFMVQWEHLCADPSMDTKTQTLARALPSYKMAEAIASAHRADEYPEFSLDSRYHSLTYTFGTLVYRASDADGTVVYYIDADDAATDRTEATDTHKTGAHGNE